MSKETVEFANQLIESLKSEYAQKRMEKALACDAQLTRVFDELMLLPHINKALYQQLIDEVGESALNVGFDDDKGQAQIEVQLTKLLRLVAEDIAEALLTVDRSGLNDDVKHAMGIAWAELRMKMDESVMAKMLIQAGISSYTQVVGLGAVAALGIEAEAFGAKNSTEEQLDSLEHFGFNIGNKINAFAQKITLDDVKSVSFRIQIRRFISLISTILASFINFFRLNENKAVSVDHSEIKIEPDEVNSKPALISSPANARPLSRDKIEGSHHAISLSSSRHSFFNSSERNQRVVAKIIKIDKNQDKIKALKQFNKDIADEIKRLTGLSNPPAGRYQFKLLYDKASETLAEIQDSESRQYEYKNNQKQQRANYLKEQHHTENLIMEIETLLKGFELKGDDLIMPHGKSGA